MYKTALNLFSEYETSTDSGIKADDKELYSLVRRLLKKLQVTVPGNKILRASVDETLANAGVDVGDVLSWADFIHCIDEPPLNALFPEQALEQLKAGLKNACSTERTSVDVKFEAHLRETGFVSEDDEDEDGGPTCLPEPETVFLDGIPTPDNETTASIFTKTVVSSPGASLLRDSSGVEGSMAESHTHGALSGSVSPSQTFKLPSEDNPPPEAAPLPTAEQSAGARPAQPVYEKVSAGFTSETEDQDVPEVTAGEQSSVRDSIFFRAALTDESQCAICEAKFTFFKRRHHCRFTTLFSCLSAVQILSQNCCVFWRYLIPIYECLFFDAGGARCQYVTGVASLKTSRFLSKALPNQCGSVILAALPLRDLHRCTLWRHPGTYSHTHHYTL